MPENPDNVSKVEDAAEEAPPQAAPLADDDEAEGVGDDELKAEGEEGE
jgi:hypothetical protein